MISRLVVERRHNKAAGGPTRKSCSLLLVSGLLAASAAPVAAQVIELSAVAGGFGPGFAINGGTTDNTGFSCASAGDVNGDGIDDVIVGSKKFGSFVSNNFEQGRAAVIFGRTSQTQAPVELSQIALGNGDGFTINGEFAGDYFGVSVSAAGDVNGDGLGDVIVGANLNSLGPYSQYSPTLQAGRSYVIFGKTSNTEILASVLGTHGFTIDGPGVSDRTGQSVGAAGDVNGDGLADLIIGSSQYSNGRAHVVFGKTSTTPVVLTSVAAGTGGFVILPGLTNDDTGTNVSCAGDVNGDGLADLIVTQTVLGAGSAAVVFGKTDTTAVQLTAIAAGLGNGFSIVGEAGGDFAGIRCAGAGDVNGDGLADLVVSATGANGIGVPTFDTGRVYVVFGKTGPAPVNLTTITNQTGNGFTIVGAYMNGNAGSSVSGAGDVNGDGLADIFVGMGRRQSAATFRIGEGHVVFGKTSSTRVELTDILNGTTSLGFAVRGEVAGDYCGLGGSGAGDVNGDGISDIIIGAPFSTPNKAYVVFSGVPVASSGTYRTQVAAGNPDAQGVGTHRFGDDEVVFADSRAWVDFDAGSGPGLAGSSEVAITLTRNDAGLTGFNSANTANVQWQATTNRTGYGTGRLTVRYTNAEITGLTESNLVMYSAPTAAGPFTPVPGFALNTARNEASGNFTSLPAVFVLSTAPPSGGIVDGDANDDGVVNIADVTAIYNDLSGIESLPAGGVANLANIGGVSVAAANAILDHLANGAPLP